MRSYNFIDYDEYSSNGVNDITGNNYNYKIIECNIMSYWNNTNSFRKNVELIGYAKVKL